LLEKRVGAGRLCAFVAANSIRQAQPASKVNAIWQSSALSDNDAVNVSTALDIEEPAALLEYLRRGGHMAPDETPAIEVLAGGVSSRTVRVTRSSGEAWVLKQSLAQLRVKVEWFSNPRRVHNEARALRWLRQLAPPGAVPALIFEDHDQHLLAMQAVPQPHANWKTQLLGGGLAERHVLAFGQLLGAIHRNSSERLAELEPDFPDIEFFESLRLEPYYRYTATQLPAAAEFLHTLIADTLAQRLALVHGDYSPKNILIYADRLILLDHEVAHLGDPAFDVGFSLTHLLSKAHHLPAQRAAFGRAAQQYWSTYDQALGAVPWRAGLEARAARHTLACLLARAAGRSPLEYLNSEERGRQQAAVLRLLADPPATIAALTERFLNQL
jgi:aminoglycoside phosphotransferase (APT) family kinase protein